MESVDEVISTVSTPRMNATCAVRKENLAVSAVAKMLAQHTITTCFVCAYFLGNAAGAFETADLHYSKFLSWTPWEQDNQLRRPRKNLMLCMSYELLLHRQHPKRP